MQTTTYTAARNDATVCQRFAVLGMTCHHCEIAVTAELSRIDGVAHVAVDVAAGTVIVESTDTLDLDKVAAAIDEAGYELAS